MKLNSGISTTDDVMKQFAGAIDKVIEESVKAAFDRHIEAFNKEAEGIKSDVIVKAIVKMSSWYNFENLGQTLRIEVRNPEANIARNGGPPINRVVAEDGSIWEHVND